MTTGCGRGTLLFLAMSFSIGCWFCNSGAGTTGFLGAGLGMLFNSLRPDDEAISASSTIACSIEYVVSTSGEEAMESFWVVALGVDSSS